MAIDQVIKQDNGDGTTTVTVTTDGGGVGTETYNNSWSQCYIDEAVSNAVRKANDDE